MLFDCRLGVRTNANTCDLSAILPENVEEEVKQQAEISMGSEISEEDILNITHLCNQVPSYITGKIIRTTIMFITYSRI